MTALTTYARSGSGLLAHIVAPATTGCAVKVTLCGHTLWPERTCVTREEPEHLCPVCAQVAGR